jgi:hypothetical protein
MIPTSFVEDDDTDPEVEIETLARLPTRELVAEIAKARKRGQEAARVQYHRQMAPTIQAALDLGWHRGLIAGSIATLGIGLLGFTAYVLWVVSR